MYSVVTFNDASLLMAFKDHFSGHSAAYHRFRPCYPQGLFRHLASLTDRHDVAWDCATGTGQAALGLAGHFQTVVATDASTAQVDHTTAHPAVYYAAMTAEHTGLATASVDLVTVAQALHWLDLELFYSEATRVLRRGGVIAVWCYGLLSVCPELDRVIRDLYASLLAPHWPPERRQVDEGYARLPFPFAPLPTQSWYMTATWTCQELIGYLGTWSAVQRLQRKQGRDPVDSVSKRLQRAWGTATRREVRWPIALRVGRAG